MCDAKGKYYSVYLTYSLCQLIVCIQKKKKILVTVPLFIFNR